MRKGIFIITCFCIMLSGLFTGCGDSGSDSLPCMCFLNNSSNAATGLRYRISGTTSWTYSAFDETVYSGDGFDCSEGTFDVAVAAGTYDFEILYSSGTIRGWTSVSYDGGNIGFWVTDLTSTSVYGAVGESCNQSGTAYNADY